MMKQTKPDSKTQDLAAFISMALLSIADTIELSVAPWEKRDYWIKADRFRREWAWAGKLGQEIREATIDEDWPSVASLAAQIGEKLSNVKVSPRHRMGTPWVGAWNKLTQEGSD
ncbi:hypothetical protein ACFLYP_02535 [Chloroflexota bacterium]